MGGVREIPPLDLPSFEVSGEVYGRCLRETSRPEMPINTGLSKEKGRSGGDSGLPYLNPEFTLPKPWVYPTQTGSLPAPNE